MEVVQILVSSGANVNEKTGLHSTPLHGVAESNNSNVEVLKYLISQGADVNAQDGDGYTPLDVVNSKEKKHVLRMAVELGDKDVEEIRSELLRRLIFMIVGAGIGGIIFVFGSGNQPTANYYLGAFLLGAYIGVGFGITKTVCQRVYGFLLEQFGDPRVAIGIMVVGSILFGGIVIVAFIAPIVTIFRLVNLYRRYKFAISFHIPSRYCAGTSAPCSRIRA